MLNQRPQLPRPAIMLVTDSQRRSPIEAVGEEWIDDLVREAALGGVNIVQLREKHLDRVALIARGLHVKDAITDRALLFVNGDPEAAVSLAADGIHLPQDGPATSDVRDHVGSKMLISRAVHDLDSAIRAERDGADIVIAGTVFDTASKPGAATLGIDGLRAIVDSVTVPVIAIGGINASNVAGVMRTRAAGIAVIGAIFDAVNPRAAARELHDCVAAVVP